MDQKHCIFPCKFADLQFSYWNTKEIFGFAICGLIITNLPICDLRTGTPQKFADFDPEWAQEFVDLLFANSKQLPSYWWHSTDGVPNLPNNSAHKFSACCRGCFSIYLSLWVKHALIYEPLMCNSWLHVLSITIRRIFSFVYLGISNHVDINLLSSDLKGLCHEMNIFWRLVKINRYFLHMRWLFLHFLFLFWERIKLNVFACSFEITC